MDDAPIPRSPLVPLAKRYELASGDVGVGVGVGELDHPTSRWRQSASFDREEPFDGPIQNPRHCSVIRLPILGSVAWKNLTQGGCSVDMTCPSS